MMVFSIMQRLLSATEGSSDVVREITCSRIEVIQFLGGLHTVSQRDNIVSCER